MTAEGIAGAIASAVIGGIFLILKLRSMWAGDTRQIANDSNATKWQDSLLQDRDAVIKRHEALMLLHIEDGKKISTLETSNFYLTEEAMRLRRLCEEQAATIQGLRSSP